MLLFAGLLRYSLRTARTIDPEDYSEAASLSAMPKNFVYTCAIQQQNGSLSFSGYALFQGERFLQVDTSVVLYCAKTGIYLKLPTAMSPEYDATASVDDGINYSFGGYYAFVLQNQLACSLSEYEICFAYRSSEHDMLVHTGQSAEATL
ncbi:MAG: hypothetical protein RSA17_07780 [Ruthenibacterium sp.]